MDVLIDVYKNVNKLKISLMSLVDCILTDGDLDKLKGNWCLKF